MTAHLLYMNVNDDITAETVSGYPVATVTVRLQGYPSEKRFVRLPL